MRALLAFAETEIAEEVPNPVLPTIQDIIWSAIFFFALWALLKYVLLPPIIEKRDARRARAAEAKMASDGTEARLRAIREEHASRLAGAKAEAARIVEEARAASDTERVGAVASVEAEIAKLKAGATSQVAGARANAMAGARGDVDNLAVAAASKVLGRQLDVSAQKSILDTVLGS